MVVSFALAFAASSHAQSSSVSSSQASSSLQPAPSESAGKTWGDYAVTQSVEVGGRDSIIHGNINNYDTFEDLNTGVRLFDYTVNMNSIDHKGLFFDNLSFTNSGYGGDPNAISRLRITRAICTISGSSSVGIWTTGITICWAIPSIRPPARCRPRERASIIRPKRWI